MSDSSPMRIRITGGTLDDREQLRRTLRSHPADVVEDDVIGSGLNPEIHAVDTHAAEQATAERAVRESQRLISIGRLSAEVVHEINNPLESVGNLLYLAAHEPGIPERAAGFLRTAESELQRVAQISRQTLSFSRESTQPIPIRLADLMDEVVSMYGRRMRQKHLTLVEDYTTSQTITAIPGEIRQVFSNLVTNAIEACAKGGRLRIRIRDTHRAAAAGTKRGVKVTVCDNGTGIPESARKRIGEIFYTTKGDAGTGLGLWVTKAIVARYNGIMRLRSSTGSQHGTIFSIFFPSTKPEHDQMDAFIHKLQTSGNVMEISRHPRHANNAAPAGDGDRSNSRVSGRQREG